MQLVLPGMKVLSLLSLNPRKASPIHKIRFSLVHMYFCFVFILTKLTMKSTIINDSKSTIINDYLFNILSILIRFDIS